MCFGPFQISLMVSVDVEHHVYLHTNFGGHLLYQATKQQLEYLNGEK